MITQRSISFRIQVENRPQVLTVFSQNNVLPERELGHDIPALVLPHEKTARAIISLFVSGENSVPTRSWNVT